MPRFPVFRLSVFCLVAMTWAAAPAAAEPPRFDLADYAGKVVVVDFWASWCVPCRRSFPWMNDMQAKYADQGLVIVGINVDADAAAAAAFLAEVPAEFDVHYSPDGSLAEEFGVVAMPSSYVFDRDGRQVARHLGFKVREQDDFEALLVETLNR